MSRIPQTFIDDLSARADIVEIVGARVQLKKAGREWKACCPFHSEKTPSFWVSPEKQFYHCFGCGAHGNALGFLMQHDRLSFPEAVEELAARLGVEVPREVQANAPARADDSQLELMMRVARFYASELARDARAQAYVEKRGLARESLEHFFIGYAPNAWNEVLKRFGGTEAARRSLAELGLIIERERGTGRDGERHYDRFRDRLMFPIRDARGRVIAFGGRVIGDGEPKYLNSPETPLFHKGRELYGLYETRQARAPLKQLLIVEGYMDTVALHQAGITYALATLGTATTDYHLKRVFKLVSRVVFAFDGDRAGRAAAWRALQIALPEAREGREIRFLFLPEGDDPDSLVRAEGREKFEERLGSALDLAQYLVRELGKDANTNSEAGLARLAERAGELLQKVPDGPYKDFIIDTIWETFRFRRHKAEFIDMLGTSARHEPPDHRGLRISGGRGGLVRQGVKLLVHFPEIAARLERSKFEELSDEDEQGAGLLRALLISLRETPTEDSNVLLERWRDKPQFAGLTRLALADPVVANADVALIELESVLQKLVGNRAARRLDQLLLKGRTGELNDEEKQELRLLTLNSSPARTSA